MKKIYLLFLTFLFATIMQAQTNLISPTGDGGFENGSTFIANGWTEVPSGTVNSFYVGGATVASGSRSAYISNNAGVAYAYTNTVVSTTHFYRDITFPAGEPLITLTFKLRGDGDLFTSTWYDKLMVFTAPTTFTPTSAAPVSPTNTLTGATLAYSQAANYGAAYTTVTVSLPSSLAGTTARVIFTWHDDASAGTVPGSIDDISLISRAPIGITSTSLGGLWSSPATWVGGAVPNGDDAVIADGATVTVDQLVNVRDLTIGGGTSGILHWNGTANALTASRNVLVNPGANLNMFLAAAAHAGLQINVGGNFTNNGTVHAAMAAAIINFNSLTSSTPSTLDGNGTFVGGIIGQLVNSSTGGVTINTSQNIITRAIAHTAGALNTNGKLSLDNTATIFGASFNRKVYNVVVTAMGTGYNSATPPTITIAAPPSGTTATATPNIDDATGTLRSITITNQGIGYASNPTVTITGGTGSGATAVAVNNRFSSGLAASSIQKSGAATITGGINIRSEQSVGALASSTLLGAGYTSAPAIGFPLPFGYQNLVTAGGSGYTSLPTVSVSGGTSLTGVTNPAFTVIVAQGRVVSVIASSGGTQWTSQPTLTITGGGGTGATAAYPANSLATATATISNGSINGYTVTNGGLGYTAAPTPTLVGGGFTTAATPFSAVALYNLTLNFFSPATSNAAHTETGLIPSNRRINSLSVTNAVSGSAFTGDIELYAAAPLTLTTSLLSLGSNTLFASHPTYAGVTGSLTNNISGNIKLSTPGGSLTRTFPFDAPFVAVMGTGSLATGSTVTSLTVSRTGAPSGSVSPSGNTTGSRAYRVVTNVGALYGTNPTVTMNYNATDALIADNPTLFIGQSAALTGPWTNRSASSGTGNLSATGSRTTATTVSGPIVPTGDDYYAWTTTFVPPTCAIPTSVVINTVTTNSANVTFTASGSSFIVEYGLIGFTPGLGATAGTGGTVVTGSTSPISLAGLIPGTGYNVYVRQDCTGAGNGYSPNSILVTFTTLYDCSALSNLTCGSSATTGNLAQAGGLYSVTTCGFTTPGRETIYTFTSTTAGTYTLNITNVNGGTGFNDYFFKIADGNCSVNTGWTCIDDLSTVIAVPFTLAANTTYYILVDAESASGTANHTFQIDCPPACPAPTSVAVPVGSITSNSANVTFTGGGSSYIAEYGLTGFTPGTGATAGIGGTIVTGTGSPITLSGLTSSTAYQVYVRQDCTGSSNGFSTNAGPIAFTTQAACPAPTAVATNTITTTSANVSFTGAGTSYIVEYGLTGFTPGIDATAGTGGTIVTGAGSPISIAGLTASTQYQVYVRQDCTSAGNGYSTNAGPIAFTTATPTITSIASGNWNSGSTWNTGNVPACTDLVIIANTHNVSVSSTGNVSRAITVQAGGTLSISSGDVTVGCTSNNTSLNNSGTLSVTGGIITVNGNVANLSGSTFNQSGGSIIVDGNANGATANSVASGTVLFSQASSLGSVTGGTVTIVDPPAIGTARSVEINLSTAGNYMVWGTGHTLNLGDGLSADASAGTVGFAVDTYVGSFNTQSLVGSIVVNGGAAANRFASVTTSTLNGTYINGSLTINSGSEMRQTTAGTVLLVNGNLINNGTFTNAAICALGNFINGSLVSSANAQSVGGSGIFRNALTPTANLTNFQIINSNLTGVTLSAPLSVSGTLTMTSGRINTDATNLLTLGYNATNAGTLNYTAGYISGPFKRWITAATGARVFPVGNTTILKNASIDFTTAPTAAGTLTALFSTTPPSFPNAAPLMEGALVVNRTSSQGSWFVDAADGLAGGTYTGTFTASGSSDVIDFAKTVLIKRPSTGGDWTLDGTHVTTTGSNAAPILSRSGMTGFSEFALGGEDITVLPISIEYFKGSKVAATNYLTWKVTCTTSPSVLLTLERSGDGRNFKTINEQNESATRCLQSFNYTDQNPLAGYNYYRLKTTSPEGKVGYSTIVVLLNKEKGFELISVAPNPVLNTAVLLLTTVKGGKIEITVADAAGRMVSKQTETVIAGNNPINMNFSKLGAGTYIITATDATGEIKTTRFVKY